MPDKKDNPSDTISRLTDTVELTRHLSAMNDRRLDLLRRVDQTGSISKAARSAGISYKAAWQAIESISNLTGSPLVEKVVGGSHGGGTKLTEVGRAALELSERLAVARAQVLAEFTSQRMPELATFATTTMRTSMRNQLPAVITRLSLGAAQARACLQLDSVNTVRASLSLESAQLLGLSVGMKVLALSKATAVEILAADASAPRSNIMRGTVARVSRSQRGGEITLRLPGGLSLVGFSQPRHGLRVGSQAVAYISPRSVVIGLVAR